MYRTLPKDLNDVFASLVRGCDRRSNVYKRYREAAEDGAALFPKNGDSCARHDVVCGSPVEIAAERLDRLDHCADQFVLTVINDQLDIVTKDFTPEEAERIKNALFLNIVKGRRRAYGDFSLLISRSEFYRRKKRFAWLVLEQFGLVDEFVTD